MWSLLALNLHGRLYQEIPDAGSVCTKHEISELLVRNCPLKCVGNIFKSSRTAINFSGSHDPLTMHTSEIFQWLHNTDPVHAKSSHMTTVDIQVDEWARTLFAFLRFSILKQSIETCLWNTIFVNIAFYPHIVRHVLIGNQPSYNLVPWIGNLVSKF